jgi:uncharacterized repeat protein (TIGR01451 family)
MKKVWVILLLVSLALWPGCRTSDRANHAGGTEPAVTAPEERGSLWDTQFKPLMSVPAEEPRTMSRVAPTATQPQTTRVARTEIESVGRPPVLQPAMMPPTPAGLQPVRTSSLTPGFEATPPIAPGLVAVSGTGAHALSIIYPRADYGIIQVDKSMPEEVRLNTPFVYVITVSNLTDTMLTDITITETLSKEFQFKGSEPTAAADGNKLVWVIDSLGPKANRSIKISGVATGGRQLEHSTAITYSVRNTAVVQIVEPALELMRAAPVEALLCEPITVEFTVTNTGTGAAQNVQITDNLPAGLQTVDGKGKVTLDAGTLAAGESRRFSIKLRATKTGAYVDKAIATSASGIKAESEATTTTVRQPILTIAKSGPKRQYLGRSVTYEITVANKGDGPAQNTIVEDMIPPGVTGVEATSGAQSSGSKLTWELGTLEPNASKSVRVSYTPTKEGEVLATATASAYCAEPVTDSIKTTVAGIAAPHLEVVDVEDPVEIGGTTTYMVTVSNEGSAADSNIRLVCTLDDKVQYVSSAGATPGSVMGKTVNFAPLRSLDSKSKATWRVIVRGVQPGDVRFKVAMHTDQLSLPVEVTEATHIYQQYSNGQ